MSLQAKKLAILKCSITCIIENMQIKKNSSDTYLFFFDIESVKKVSVKSKRCRLIFIKIRSVCKRITHMCRRTVMQPNNSDWLIPTLLHFRDSVFQNSDCHDSTLRDASFTRKCGYERN